jgi:restriction system protein
MVLGVIAALAVVWAGAQVVEHPLFLLAVIAILISGIVYLRRRRENDREMLLEILNTRVDEHLPTLVVRQAQLVRRDPYGKVDTSKWKKELSGFIADQIEPYLTKTQSKMLLQDWESLFSFIDDLVNEAAQKQPAFSVFDESMQPSDFEVFCADELRRAGWDARVTSQSRDQGADVIAEKDNLRVVVQCKLYSRPVGNKAVQEVVAARAHQRASYGVVVTNSSYTSAAEQLAATNGVMLLHYLELRDLDRQLEKFRLQNRRFF